jgi:hypothetical protein
VLNASDDRGKCLPDYTAHHRRKHHNRRRENLKSQLLMFSVFRSEQVFSFIKNVKSRTEIHVIDEHLERCARIATEIKPDIERLLKQKQRHLSY